MWELVIQPKLVFVALLNTRSLLTSMDELTLLVTNFHIDVITISETWLDKSILDSEMSLPNYSLLRRNRNRQGVAVYISSTIRFISRPELQ